MENDYDFVLTELRNPERAKPVRQIAEEADVPYYTIQKWMRSEGTRNPRFHTVQKLAEYFRNEEDGRQRGSRRRIS
jgi:DNA-binding phage protein